MNVGMKALFFVMPDGVGSGIECRVFGSEHPGTPGVNDEYTKEKIRQADRAIRATQTVVYSHHGKPCSYNCYPSPDIYAKDIS